MCPEAIQSACTCFTSCSFCSIKSFVWYVGLYAPAEEKESLSSLDNPCLYDPDWL